MSIDTNWIPKVSVGTIKFGDSIDRYLKTGLLQPSEFNVDHPDEPSFEDEDDILSVQVDESGTYITSILSSDELSYNGVNLIGLSTGELTRVLSSQPDETEVEENVIDEVNETIFYFLRMGLMVWIRDDKARFVAVDDGNYED